MLALLLAILLSFLGTQNVQAQNVVTIPPMPACSPQQAEDAEWIEFWSESYEEHADAFTRHFESLTYKRAKNGRSMVNGKFVKMGV